MAKLLGLPFQTASDFTQCRWLGANGVFQSGTSLPDGIPGRISIQDASCRLHLNTSDSSTANWKRTEIDFGEFPAAFGEYWTTFDFQYQWNYPGFIVIGSWPAMYEGQSGIAYVPLGFRIRDHHLLIQVSRDFSQAQFFARNLVATPIQLGRWHRVCAHVNLRPDNTGFREVLLDGVPIVREWNVQTTYGAATAHYFKLGPYDGDHKELFSAATLLLRNVAMWSGNDGYQTVMGSVPLCPPRMLDV